MAKPTTIAIDGTAAAGKSTVAASLAQSLGYLYFDTGVMYRAVTWAVLAQNIKVNDEEKVSIVAETLSITVTAEGPEDGRPYTVLADGRDVTWQIRDPQVDANVSKIASYPRVRQALTLQQRRIASVGSIVMVGRDIGTVVLPEAQLKIFMMASPEERAKRRYKDSLAQGQTPNYEEILTKILERDALDRMNPVSPMQPAEDAIIVDTDKLSIEAVLAQIQELVVLHTKNGKV